MQDTYKAVEVSAPLVRIWESHPGSYIGHLVSIEATLSCHDRFSFGGVGGPLFTAHRPT